MKNLLIILFKIYQHTNFTFVFDKDFSFVHGWIDGEMYKTTDKIKLFKDLNDYRKTRYDKDRDSFINGLQHINFQVKSENGQINVTLID